ncbi:hypothetical protein DFH09DRAFT_1416296 [Mycena vulgaris]|nr:hypothetical protein DFH09DRAFT_1416296 [Mycena vulgaris]
MTQCARYGVHAARDSRLAVAFGRLAHPNLPRVSWTLSFLSSTGKIQVEVDTRFDANKDERNAPRRPASRTDSRAPYRRPPALGGKGAFTRCSIGAARRLLVCGLVFAKHNTAASEPGPGAAVCAGTGREMVALSWDFRLCPRVPSLACALWAAVRSLKICGRKQIRCEEGKGTATHVLEEGSFPAELLYAQYIIPKIPHPERTRTAIGMQFRMYGGGTGANVLQDVGVGTALAIGVALALSTVRAEERYRVGTIVKSMFCEYDLRKYVKSEGEGGSYFYTPRK